MANLELKCFGEGVAAGGDVSDVITQPDEIGMGSPFDSERNGLDARINRTVTGIIDAIQTRIPDQDLTRADAIRIATAAARAALVAHETATDPEIAIRTVNDEPYRTGLIPGLKLPAPQMIRGIGEQ